MSKKFFTIFLLVLFSTMLFAQQKAVLRADGTNVKLNAKTNLHEALKEVSVRDGQKAEAVTFLNKVTGLIDTMRYMGPGDGDVRFGYDPGDYMIQYFVAPTEMTIKGVGFHTNDVVADAAAVEVKLVSIDMPLETIQSFALGTGGYYFGYFEGTNDHGISALPDDETTTGAWVDKGNAATSPFGADLWSDAGLGAPAIPVNGADVWVSMDLLGFEPEVAKGTVFGVVVKNISPAGTDVLRADALSGGPAAGMKYYANGRLQTDPTDPGFDPGWWIRTGYTWNMAVAVEYTGDTPPVISGVTSLGTTLSTDARMVEATITDENPSGGAAGVASAMLKYSVDGGDMQEVAMTGSGDVFSADIPGQQPGSAVTYSVMATDVGGNSVESQATTYNIFKPTEGVSSLLVLNGGSDGGYPVDYYFRKAPVEGQWYDKWAYGALTDELLVNYKNVFEICTGGPLDYNDDAITAWLAADGTNNYFLSGEEWLGARVGYADETYAAGSFQYDVLGLAASYNDITYDGASGQELPSLVFAVDGSDLGGNLFTEASGADSLLYDPIYEIGSASNWMDGFDVSTASVDMNVETRGVAGAADVRILPAAAHNTTTAGNKVVFMTMDPISINSVPYEWWGDDSTAAIQYTAAEWFGAFVVSVEDEQLNPTEFSLEQNYPNPFNPATTITFSLTQKSDVSLKVFNLLGQEVATVVNGVKPAGVHKVNFDASELTSGVYFYTIKSGEFVSTKKMILLK